jgi:hypothetical protein
MPFEGSARKIHSITSTNPLDSLKGSARRTHPEDLHQDWRLRHRKLILDGYLNEGSKGGTHYTALHWDCKELMITKVTMAFHMY